MTHGQLAILFGGLALVLLGWTELWRRYFERRRQARRRALWDAVCQRWMREGMICGYALGDTMVALEFAPHEWVDGLPLAGFDVERLA